MDTRNKVTITACETSREGLRVFVVKSMINSIEFRIGDVLHPCDVEELLRTKKYTLKIVGDEPFSVFNAIQNSFPKAY